MAGKAASVREMGTRSGWLSPWQYWILTAGSLLVLLLVAINIWLFSRNQELQAEANERQQFINESIQISRLNTQFIQALANLAAQTGDEQIRALLAEHGVTFNVKPFEGGASSAPSEGSQR